MKDLSSDKPEGNVDYDDEIDLADYISVIIKRKWLIVVGTLLCFLLGIAYSSTQKQAYEARASLLVIPPPYKTELAPPTFSMDVYEELSKAQDLRQSVIDSLDLHDREGKKLSISGLDGLLESELVQATVGPQIGLGPSMLHLIVTSVDTISLPPVKIANSWAELFVQKNSGISSQETGGSYEFIRDQYEIARENLQQAEDSMIVFNQRINVEILKSDLAPTNSKLVESQAAVVNTTLELRTLEESLVTNEKYLFAVETSDGQWVGSWDVQGNGDVNLASLDNDQMRVLETTARNRDEVKKLRAQVRHFQDENDLTLVTDDLEMKRKALIRFMDEGSRIEVDKHSVSQSIRELSQLGRANDGMSSAIVENLPPEALREIVSLSLGYNLFIPRQKYIALEIVQLKDKIDIIENELSDHMQDLSPMLERLATAEYRYQSLGTQYREIKTKIDKLKVSINSLRPKVVNQTEERVWLERKTKSLVVKITSAELEQTRLLRNFAVYKSTFDKFSGLLENARVAKASQSSDVKIVARAVDAVALSSRFLRTISIFGMVGFFSTLLLAFFLESVTKVRAKMD